MNVRFATLLLLDHHHYVATDLRHMGSEEFLMEPCLVTFRDENGVIHALCLENVDDFMLAYSDSPFGNMSLKTSTTCMNGELWSHECLHSAARESHKPTTNTPEQGRI